MLTTVAGPSPPPSPQPSPPPSMETETDTTGGSDDSDIPDQEVVTDDGTMNDEYLERRLDVR